MSRKSNKPQLFLAEWEDWLVESLAPNGKRSRLRITGERAVALNKERGILVSPEDEDLLRVIWPIHLAYCSFYATRKWNRKTISLSRVIARRMAGRELFSFDEVDHLNHRTLDNRRLNLSLGTKQDNMNRRLHTRPNKTGYRGVSKGRKNFEAYIRIHGKSRNLGTFKTALDAAMAYDAAASSLGRIDLNFNRPVLAWQATKFVIERPIL